MVNPDNVKFSYSVQGQTEVSYTWVSPTGDPTGTIKQVHRVLVTSTPTSQPLDSLALGRGNGMATHLRALTPPRHKLQLREQSLYLRATCSKVPDRWRNLSRRLYGFIRVLSAKE